MAVNICVLQHFFLAWFNFSFHRITYFMHPLISVSAPKGKRRREARGGQHMAALNQKNNGCHWRYFFRKCATTIRGSRLLKLLAHSVKSTHSHGDASRSPTSPRHGYHVGGWGIANRGLLQWQGATGSETNRRQSSANPIEFIFIVVVKLIMLMRFNSHWSRSFMGNLCSPAYEILPVIYPPDGARRFK